MGKVQLLIALAIVFTVAGALVWPHGGVGLLVFGVVSLLGAVMLHLLETAPVPALESTSS